eukprot:351773-Chlamydomonas_euryale.AAC.11
MADTHRQKLTDAHMGRWAEPAAGRGANTAAMALDALSHSATTHTGSYLSWMGRKNVHVRDRHLSATCRTCSVAS